MMSSHIINRDESHGMGSRSSAVEFPPVTKYRSPQTGAYGWKWSVPRKPASSEEHCSLFVMFVLRKLVSDVAAPSHLSAWVPDAIDSPSYWDVTFSFSGTDRTLHASSAFLSAQSPYYKRLFASDFAETSKGGRIVKTLPAKLPSSSNLNSKRPRDLDEDSDTEVDLPPSRQPTSPYPIPVHGACFTTFREVLRWIYSREISFAPLKSTRATGSGEPKTQKLGSNSNLVVPVSPKSVYRLADFLELPELQTIALAAYLRQISTINIAQELMSEVSALYGPVQDALLQYAANNWRTVKESEGWKVLEKRIEDADETLPSQYPMIYMKLTRML
ncbi:hypothetical protein P7C70_g5247, partial [Phenoliferia sp. Uapishka_3]